MIKKSEFRTIGSLMIQGAREALTHKRGQLEAPVTQAKATARHVEVVPPPEYDKEHIQAVRERLGVSQSVFADLLGASLSTVQAWERGAREPRATARRLLEVVERHPHVFDEDLAPVE